MKIPAELLTFCREEWVAPDDGASWALPFRRWQIARHAWVKACPDSELGDMGDVLRAGSRLKRELRDWVP